MTSTTVTNRNQFYANVTGNAAVSKKKESTFMDCFSQIYSGEQQSAGQNAQTIKAPQKSENLQVQKAHKQETLHTGHDSNTAEKIATEVKDLQETDWQDEAEGDIKEATDAMVQIIAEQLGISQEAVREAMQQAGMQPTDLLNAEQVTQLMVDLAGSGNSLELLTNGELYQDVAQVTEQLEDILGKLSDELNVTPEELKQLLEAAKKQMEAASKQPVTEETAARGEQKTEDASKTAASPMEQQAANKVIEEAAASKEGPVKETAQEEPVIIVENEKPLETVVKQETAGQGSTGKESSGEEQKGNAVLEQLGNQPTGKTDMTAILQELAGEVHQAPDTESIMKQIVDYMKVQVKADLTQMEIQLHPASLGNINVQISAREGVITAQFTAQNEAVKTALETQVVQLKETLAEQGVKVEAVEVTIASHEFERNLEQNHDRSNDAKQEQKKGLKKINLNLGAEEEPDIANMDDSDRIVADMMARNGNTVDFSA